MLTDVSRGLPVGDRRRPRLKPVLHIAVCITLYFMETYFLPIAYILLLHNPILFYTPRVRITQAYARC